MHWNYTLISNTTQENHRNEKHCTVFCTEKYNTFDKMHFSYTAEEKLKWFTTYMRCIELDLKRSFPIIHESDRLKDESCFARCFAVVRTERVQYSVNFPRVITAFLYFLRQGQFLLLVREFTREYLCVAKKMRRAPRKCVIFLPFVLPTLIRNCDASLSILT